MGNRKLILLWIIHHPLSRSRSIKYKIIRKISSRYYASQYLLTQFRFQFDLIWITTISVDNLMFFGDVLWCVFFYCLINFSWHSLPLFNLVQNINITIDFKVSEKRCYLSSSLYICKSHTLNLLLLLIQCFLNVFI